VPNTEQKCGQIAGQFTESVLTVAGGRIVYASPAYEGQDERLPTISVGWSPVAYYGFYQARLEPRGVAQASGFPDAAADSAEQSAWQRARGETVTQRTDLDAC